MPLRHQVPWLLTAMVASVTAMVSGAHARLPTMTLAAAALFALALIAVAVQINRPLWGGQTEPDTTHTVHAVRRNARLMALGYIWGAAALFAVYGFSGLRWQHAWQYGLAMTIIAAGIILYVHDLGRAGSARRSQRALDIGLQLTIAQALGALFGLGFLLASGKLAGIKGDWAANQIFLNGGVAVAVLSAIAAYTQYRLRLPAFPTRERPSGA
jgi:hypothetical protein